MFMGEYQHSIDNKGRLIIPAKFREELGDTFVITKGLDNCLFVYPNSEWKIFEEKLKTLPITNANARKFVRFFLAGAVECNVDKQGRILIPNNLRNYSGIDKDVILIGVTNRVEIWSKENWDKYNNEDFDASELAENMQELGI
ncbi:MAG TPA: division/cell wall cluster transcriptional repressor MraZ [Defluviitaleaceae bacterium]|jgi:MraZ protein|nr:division/cell wall cluster transcriptional repressor MraZ [Candidatus Epulonipiscium sp.]HOQ16551.1 division/cell wall cluster transcriptional repressor MraZ [Defluviitaleaceae bacterium]HPT75873.1 division/cell wall cluster transcriptional repressor MraZ [Defluviitaleaceae bacterium]HQD51048.1 division/cell wall cluster transcriptional repressor MraZ [Defluviitaleaceae bacterium]